MAITSRVSQLANIRQLNALADLLRLLRLAEARVSLKRRPLSTSPHSLPKPFVYVSDPQTLVPYRNVDVRKTRLQGHRVPNCDSCDTFSDYGGGGADSDCFLASASNVERAQ
jgi:hypothetical protein